MDEMIYLDELVSRYPALEQVKDSVKEVYQKIGRASCRERV